MRFLRLIFICLWLYMTWTTWRAYPISDYGLFGSNLSHTNAVITSAEAELVKFGRGRRAYELIISYRYEVNEASYSNDAISLKSQIFDDYEDAKLASQEYKIGSTYVVHYSAKNPQFSLLKKGFPWGSLLFTMFISLMFGLGVLATSQDQPKKSNKAR